MWLCSPFSRRCPAITRNVSCFAQTREAQLPAFNRPEMASLPTQADWLSNCFAR